AHIYTGAISPVTFTFAATTRTSPPGGISYWGAVATAFFGIPVAPDTVAPTVPMGVTVTSVTTSRVNLSWSASSDNIGVTGYRVFRDGSLVGTSPSTTFADQGLTPQTSYSYTLAAVDAAGNVSALSAPVSASTTYLDLTPPTVPLNVRSSNVTTN